MSSHAVESHLNPEETEKSNNYSEMAEDPYLQKHRICEYEGVPAVVTSVTTGLTADTPSWRSRLTCPLYTNGERDLTRAKYRKLVEGKEAFATCKGRWHVEKVGNGPWKLLKRKDHTCHVRTCQIISAAAPARESSEVVSVIKNPEVKDRVLRGEILSDTRPSVEFIHPPLEIFLEFKRNRYQLLSRLEGFGNKWRGITGGDSKRWYLPNAATDTDIRELLDGPTRWVRKYITSRYPSMKYFRLGAIKTGPMAPSQYDGHRHRLHSDYSDEVSFRSPEDRPLSFMIALDRFELMYLPHRSLTRDDVVTKVVDPGEVVIITNYCLHSGGENKTNEMVYRLSGYMASNEADFPPENTVYLKRWGIDTGDAVLSKKKSRR